MKLRRSTFTIYPGWPRFPRLLFARVQYNSVVKRGLYPKIQHTEPVLNLLKDSPNLFPGVSRVAAYANLFPRLKSALFALVGLALILGGAVGNLVDRIRLGFVIDFLDFSIKGYHWPAFNLADSAVTIGTLWLLLNLILGKSLSEAKP